MVARRVGWIEDLAVVHDHLKAQEEFKFNV